METTDPRFAPTIDLAIFALSSRWLRAEAVIEWADGIILANDRPPYWAIDLAVVPPYRLDVFEALRALADGPRPEASIHFMAALVLHRWKRELLDLVEVCDACWWIFNFASQHAMSTREISSFEYLHFFFHDYEIEKARSTACAEASETLERFSGTIPHLPKWIVNA